MENRVKIEEVLENKDLFWKYILGSDFIYKKNFEIPILDNPEDVFEIPPKPKKELSEREKKMMELKAKLAKKSESKKEETTDELDYSKIEQKYQQIINDLKGNIYFWQKRRYNLYGCEEDGKYGIEFERDNISLKYFPVNEQISKNYLIGAVEIILLSDFIKMVSDDAKNFCEMLYQNLDLR